MDPENLVYALVQVAHNFGAAAVIGTSVAALAFTRQRHMRLRLAWWMMVGWLTQAASGAAFGAVSLYYYGQLPDIQGVAIVALWTKIGCASLGYLLGMAYLGRPWSERTDILAWRTEAGLGLTALTAAAFLRWFS